MRPESISWPVTRGARVALLCGATAGLTDQKLLKRRGPQRASAFHGFPVYLVKYILYIVYMMSFRIASNGLGGNKSGFGGGICQAALTSTRSKGFKR